VRFLEKFSVQEGLEIINEIKGFFSRWEDEAGLLQTQAQSEEEQCDEKVCFTLIQEEYPLPRRCGLTLLSTELRKRTVTQINQQLFTSTLISQSRIGCPHCYYDVEEAKKSCPKQAVKFGQGRVHSTFTRSIRARTGEE
jgi:hypothetical protein